MSAGRRQFAQLALFAIFEEPYCSVRPLLDLPDACAHVPLIGLARRLAVKRDTDQRLGRKAADEHSALPIGKELAGINDCSSRRDDGVPGHFWRFEFRMGIMVRDGLPVIMVRSEERRVGKEGVSTCKTRW